LIICFHEARPWILPSTHSFFTRVCIVVKSSCKLPHFRFSLCLPVCVSVRPSFRMYQRGSIHGFPRNFVLEAFIKICRGNSNFESGKNIGHFHENLGKFHFFRRQ
jgi:hypothetical protein